jgi:signal peptidase I
MKRKMWVAFLLSMLTPGMGQMYNGQLKKGIVFYLVYTIANIGMLILIATYSSNRVLNIFAVFLALFLYFLIAFKAAIQSRKLIEMFAPKRYNRWYFYGLYFLVIGFLVNYPIGAFARSKLVHAYRIPSGAMENTVLVSDCLLANLIAYSERRPPSFNDVVIFKYFGVERKDYNIKRIVGVSGQDVMVTGKHVFLDGTKIPSPPEAIFIREGVNPYFPDTFKIHIPSPGDRILVSGISPRDFLFLYYLAKQESRDVKAEIQIYFSGEYVHTLSLGKVDNWIVLDQFLSNLLGNLKNKGKTDSLEFMNTLAVDGMKYSEYTVKKPVFFVMGDNRDNSLDSRYYGCVSLASIRGKAKLIYMSIDKEIPIFNLTKWIRWKRIGRPIS